MELDYNPATDYYILKVRPGDKLGRQELMRDYGFDYSLSASQPGMDVLCHRSPFVAVAFSAYSTEQARVALAPIDSSISHSWATHSNGHIDVPSGCELSPYQIAGVEYALHRRHCLIGDEPGLGKTCMAVAYANEQRASRVLVLCPAQIRRQWVSEIRKWSTIKPRPVCHLIDHGRRGFNPNAHYTVCSYDLARTDAVGGALAHGAWDVLVLDEAHFLKTTDAGRTRAVFGGGRSRAFPAFAEKARHILALTGTPLPNRPREAYVLAKNLCPDAIDWMGEDAFRAKFNPSRRLANGFNLEEQRGHSELQSRLRAYFMVRRFKRSVLPQLKLPVYNLIYAEDTGEVRRAVEAERLLDLDPNSLAGPGADVFGQVSTVRRMMGIALAPHAIGYAKMLLDGGVGKIGIGAWHKEVMDIIQRGLSSYGVVRVDGSTSAAAKDRAISQFRGNPRVRCVLGNLISFGTGTDGVQDVCSHALLAEPDWVPGNNDQFFSRFDRRGQTRQVQGDILVADGSYAEKVLSTALNKMNNIDKALDRRLQ